MIGIPDKVTFISDLLNTLFILIVLMFTVRCKDEFTNRFPSLNVFYKMIIILLSIALLGNMIDVFDELEINGHYFKTQITIQLTSWIFAITIGLLGVTWIKLLTTITRDSSHIPVVRENKIKDKDIHIDPGVYLCKDEDCCRELFSTFLGRFPALVVGRDPPDIIREKFDIKETPILWISKIEGMENTIYPTNLPYLMQTLVNFMKKEDTPKIILLEGIEYLIEENGFSTMFKFLTTLKDYAIINKSIILIPIESRAFEERELYLLLREFEIIS